MPCHSPRKGGDSPICELLIQHRASRLIAATSQHHASPGEDTLRDPATEQGCNGARSLHTSPTLLLLLQLLPPRRRGPSKCLPMHSPGHLEALHNKTVHTWRDAQGMASKTNLAKAAVAKVVCTLRTDFARIAPVKLAALTAVMTSSRDFHSRHDKYCNYTWCKTTRFTPQAACRRNSKVVRSRWHHQGNAIPCMAETHKSSSCGPQVCGCPGISSTAPTTSETSATWAPRRTQARLRLAPRPQRSPASPEQQEAR